jgi:hypothetical protein
MKCNQSLVSGKNSLPRLLLAAVPAVFSALMISTATAATPRAAVSTINHAFATELGTGFYDIGGRSVFIATFAPSWDFSPANQAHPGIRLVVPASIGSFDFVPDEALNGRLPRHIDSYSLTPGIEFDFQVGGDWMLTPWVKAGGSFAGGASDGFLYGAGARLTREAESGGRRTTQLHELALVNVNYAHLPDDSFLRLRNAVDVRKPTLPLGPRHRLLTGLYGIIDVVPDPPATPAGVKPAVVQLETGFTLNGDPRPQIGRVRWPRLGFGYRFAGDFSGWRIVIGAPF